MTVDVHEIIISRKNASAIQQIIEQLNVRVYEQQKRIDGLVSTISTLSERLNKIELMVQVQKSISYGHGPSVKEG